MPARRQAVDNPQELRSLPGLFLFGVEDDLGFADHDAIPGLEHPGGDGGAVDERAVLASQISHRKLPVRQLPKLRMPSADLRVVFELDLALTAAPDDDHVLVDRNVHFARLGGLVGQRWHSEIG